MNSEMKGTSLPPAPATANVTQVVIACPECDLLQTEVALAPYATARCSRCSAFLYRNVPHGLERALVCTITGCFCFFLANVFPLISLELQKTINATSLLGAIKFLFEQDLPAVAALVFVCLVLVPLVEMSALLYILLPLRFGRLAPGLPIVFRIVQWVRPWSMVEVFMLGVLVSAVRVSSFASVEAGVAVWSFAVLMLSIIASAWFFNERELWECVQAHAKKS